MVRIRASSIILVAAFGLGVSGWSATSTERDQHAQAIAALIAAGMRLPAERQLAGFQAARYPADASLDVVLRFLQLERFFADLPVAERETRAAELKRLRDEMARLRSSMSTSARVVLVRGTGTSVQLVNAIARVAHPDGAPPLVSLAAEKSARLRGQVARLITVMEDEFHQALTVVQAHEAADLAALDLPVGSPQHRSAIQALVDRHLAALRPLRTGMQVLREVVARGNHYGIDPQPVRERVRALFAARPPKATSTSVVALIADWEFAWGEISPVLGEWCGSLLGDAVALGLSEVRPDEVDAIQRRLLEIYPRQQQDERMQIEILGMQVRVTTDAMRWRLQRGDRVGLAEAWEWWQQFGQRAQQDKRLAPGRSPQLATDIARLHLLAARIAAAMGNHTEAGMVLQRFIATEPTPPFDHFAKGWRAHFPPPGGFSRPDTTQAMDPARAIALARAHLDEAKATSDAQVVRRQHLHAAAVLRSGILGLSTQRGEDRSTVEHLVQLYHLYVLTLNRLEMRHHAAIAALSGTDQALLLIERMERQKQANPWKRITTEGRPAWDDQRVTPLRLATDGMIIANQLKARDPGMNGLYLAAVERLGRVDPTGKGGNLTRQQIIAMIAEEDYDGALREAEHLLRAMPEQDAWVSNVRNRAIPALAERLRRAGEQAKADGLLAHLARENTAMLAKAQTELARPDLTPARRQELERALGQIHLAEVEALAARQEHGAVIDRLIGMLDGATDLADGTRLRERLAQAAGEWVAAQHPTATTPLPVMQEIVGRLDQVRALVQPDAGGDLPVMAAKRLALAYHRVRSALPTSIASGADADVRRLVRQAGRGFAESLAPTIDEQTPVGNLMALGQAWWDLDEPARAAPPFERGLVRSRDDAAVSAFLGDAGTWLAPFTAVVTTRAEFREQWEDILAACGVAGRPLALSDALERLVALRLRLDAGRQILGAETHLRLLTAIAEVEGVVRRLITVATAHRRLAACYRALGRPEAAIPHLQRLRVLEPQEPAHRLALVLATLGSATATRADLEQARRLAAEIRDGRHGTTDRTGYWEASPIVLELSLMLGDQRMVDDTLAFMGRNRSDLSRDLVLPPVAGDDRRVRRPAGADAVMLAQHFLDLHGKQGITVRPPFRIAQVEGGDGLQPLFVDHGVRTPVARMVTQDGRPVLVYVVEDGAPAGQTAR